MRSVFKFIFYTYVVLLAGYASYKTLLSQRVGSFQVKFFPPDKECFQGGVDWKYCVHTTPNSKIRNYLYVFHGKGGDENSWAAGKHYAGLLQQYWQKKQMKTPIVITVSFGKTWLITKRMTKENTGLLEKFQEEVFSIVEDNLGRARKRFLLGNSMGALNAITMSLEMPSYFTRVAALCPPLFEVSPYDSWKKWAQFIYRTGAKPKSLFTVIGLGRSLFTNNLEWMNFSPLEKVRHVRYKKYQKFYITAGVWDEFGLYEGVLDFVKGLEKSGATVLWRPQSGGHCSADIKSLAEFFAL